MKQKIRVTIQLSTSHDVVYLKLATDSQFEQFAEIKLIKKDLFDGLLGKADILCEMETYDKSNE